MGAINNIFGMPPGMNKAEKSKQVGGAGNDSANKGKARKAGDVSDASGFDKAMISMAAQKLLTIKSEAVQFTAQVKDAKTISEAEIHAIKEKIATDFYFDPEVIDKIVDKLVALPNFK